MVVILIQNKTFLGKQTILGGLNQTFEFLSNVCFDEICRESKSECSIF
jgi:hypothetical protein